MTKVDGSVWLHCEDADGELGWLQDPEEFQYDAENGFCGYFKEAVFAG